MIVFKFGGASIKNADAIRNMGKIIQKYSMDKLLVVVSAMGKTTNELESILEKSRKKEVFNLELETLKINHFKVCKDLFENIDSISTDLEVIFKDLAFQLESDQDYDKQYDQVIAKGELLSSTIVAHYLKDIALNIKWIDSREYIKTDSNYRGAYVNWDITENLINELHPVLKDNIILTQGFIGMAEDGTTTTLGREGSDYSGAIFASCLKAKSLTVWKDVPGILNADPKLIHDAELFSQLPYQEAAEMTYYGASVIHPKTIKPLANRNIPLYVRSFDHPDEPGTIIHDCSLNNSLATTIIKNNQCLVSFKVIDFTFINEQNLSLIFQELALLDIKINIMQNSAISFSIVVDYRNDKLEELITVLKDHFDIRFNTGLTLITIKNYKSDLIDIFRKNKKILLEQISRNNYRALIES
jgi:aspartate kinase